MTDLQQFIQFVAAILQEIAKQAELLGAGLQNAAPSGSKVDTSSAILYLFAIASYLKQQAEICERLVVETPHDLRYNSKREP
ncbi:MAG: hypothetical protein A3F12_06335 [Gammaproteobacteria bacterium RIFCSPHIGHO2_12_FULL_38_14]|nr:MAG: hypothetical protein A3F12_06335 [Gammaproteobacteria bacterium RIFCSPHIGHO2_12_FULL_38_14]